MTIATITVKVDGKDAEKNIRKIESSLKKLDKSSKKTQASMTRLSGGFSKLGVAAGVAGLAIGVVLVKALSDGVKSAVAFEKSMAEIATLLSGDVEQSTLQLKEGIEQMSLAYGGDLTTNAQAAYSIISAGASTATEAIDLLDAANKLAIGGVTDVATAADGLTSALNAYGASSDEATAYSDTMFVAMKAGKTTIGELSAVVGNTAPMASQLGISFDELEASIAALTTTGLQTSVAGTQIQAVFTSLVKITPKATKEAERLGLEFSAQALRAKGLAGFLADVKDKTGGSTVSMGKLFGSVEAVKAVMSLAGGQAEKFAEILADMDEKAGSTDVAFDKMTQTLDFEWGKLQQSFVAIGKALGEDVLPELTKFVTSLNFVITALFDLDAYVETPFATLAKAEAEAAQNILDLQVELRSLETQLEDLGDSNDFNALAKSMAAPEIEEQIESIRWEIQEYRDDIIDLKIAADAAEKALRNIGTNFDKTAFDYGAIDDVPEKADEAADAIKEVGDKAKYTAKELAAFNDELSAFGGSGEPIYQYVDKSTEALNAFEDSLLDSEEAAGLVGDKIGIVNQLLEDEVISAEVAGDALESLGVKGVETTSLMTDSFENMLVDIQRGWGDLFEDELSQILADFGIEAEGIFGVILDAFISMIAKMAAAWAAESIFGGGISSANSLFSGGTGGITAAAGAIKGYIASLTGAVGATAALASETGAVVTAMGSMAPAVQGASIVTSELGASSLVAQGELAALSESTAGATVATEGLSAGMGAMIGVSAFAVGAMILHARHNKMLAETAEEVQTKFQTASDVIHTSSLTWGTWGDQGLIALNNVKDGTQTFADIMRAADVSVRIGADGMAILGDNTEQTRQLVLAYNDAVSGGLSQQMDLIKQKQGLLETEGSDRAEILQIEKDITAQWQESMELINSTEFDAVVTEFQNLYGVSESVFRDMASDGIFTAKEIDNAFGDSAGDIKAAMGDLTSVTVTQLRSILSNGKSSASGIASGFRSAAGDMSDSFGSGTNTIQNAIDGLHGVDIQSTHTIITTNVDRDADFATGTSSNGFIVPAGYPNDSFGIGVTSGETVYVDTPAQRGRSEVGNSVDTRGIEHLLEIMIGYNVENRVDMAALRDAVYETGTDNVNAQEGTLRAIESAS